MKKGRRLLLKANSKVKVEGRKGITKGVSTSSTCCAYAATLALFRPPLITMAVITSEVGSWAYLEDARCEEGVKGEWAGTSRQLDSHFFIIIHLSGTEDSRHLLLGSIIRNVAGAIISAQNNH
jgi:hypothetical protein